MAKDETEIGFTGGLIPKKKRSPAKQHEFEKKRRANLGTNVGGVKYSKDVTSYYNPRTKTFEEFMSVCEAVSQSDKKLAQSGVLSRHADALQREIDAAASGKTKPVTKSASRKVTKQSYEVREENDTQSPPTKEEKRKIKLMQQLERLKKEKSASRIQSDVAREEYEVEEGYVDWEKGSLTVPSRVKGNKRTQSPKERAGSSQFRKMADAQTTRGTQGKIGKKGKLARLAAKQQDVIQKTTQKYRQDKG